MVLNSPDKKEAFNEEDKRIKRKKVIKMWCSFLVCVLALAVLFVISVNIGSLKVSAGKLFEGLFIRYDPKVSSIFDLRFPRIVIAMLAGAAISVSGVLFQAVLKNPLADPGIIGISSGAGFFAVIAMVILPSYFFLVPLIACVGGIFAFFLVYTLSWKGGLSPLRIILVGVAINAMFTGLAGGLNSFSGGNMGGVAAIVNGNITMKTWKDVETLFPYVVVGLILAVLFASVCNLLSLEDKTAMSLGINVNRMRIMISVIAALLASISTAIVGSIGFLGLIVPHIGRILVGSNHKVLLPFSMILGAFSFLLADTFGRTVAMPYEIPASIIMSIVGGPFFVVLLRRSKQYGK